MEVQLLDPAQEEIDEAHDFYEIQMRGLGFLFLDELFHRVKSIKHCPEAWPHFLIAPEGVYCLNFPTL